MSLEKIKSTAKAALSDQNGALSRRKILIGAGGLAGVSVAALSLANRGGAVSTPVGTIDPKNAQAIGDGFYLADGWVLSAEDLRLAGKE